MGKRKAQMRSNTTHVSHVTDLLSGKKKPKNERKANEINPKKIDKAIQPFFDSLVKYIVAQKSIVKRVSEAKQSVRTLLMEKWAKEYAKKKEHPESVRYMSEEGQSLLHVVTTKISYSEDKKESLDEYGIDLDDYVEVTGVKINYQNLPASTKKELAKFLSKIDNLEDHVSFTRRVKPELIDGLSDMVAKKDMVEVVKILQPESKFHSASSKNCSEVDCLEYSKDMAQIEEDL